MSVPTFIAWFVFLINLIAFLLMGIDKNRARNNQWRISESTLIIISLIGGAIGTFIGMFCFHHKTKKAKFAVGIPLILILHLGLIITFFYILPIEYYTI